MSYRKITVNEKSYEYVIGKTHTKVKGFGLFVNAEVGNFIAHPDSPIHSGPRSYLVTPSTVAKIIGGDKVPTAYKCKLHGITTDDVVADPQVLAATGKTRYIPHCPECYKVQKLA